MSSELDNDNSESLHFSTPPEKIDPRDTPLLDDRNGESNQGLLDNEEKGDPPKLEDLVSSGSSTTNAGHFYRDVYSSSPEEDIDLEAAAGEDEDKFIEIFVSEPHKVGEGISCYMAYKVSTKTNLKIFRRESFSVTRRFSDFLGLHEKLVEKHGPRGRIIPPAPEKSLMGTTRVKINSNSFDGNSAAATQYRMSSQQTDEALGERKSEKEFIARRRVALERFVNRVAHHPVLRKDSTFMEFLESSRDLPRATSTSALSSASVFRLIGKVGDTMTKITYKMEETDPWYEDKIVQLEALENQLKKLYTLTEAVTCTRRELAIATGQFAVATSQLSITEDSNNLSKALSSLAKVEEKVEKVQHKQADADYVHLFELIKDYVALMSAVKDALTERQKAFQAWQHAQSMVLKKKEQRARLEMGNKTDKIPAASEEVQEWETKLEESRANFLKVSEVVKAEIDFFERYRVKDFKTSIIQYMEELMDCQLKMVQYWEEFIPEVKNTLY